MPGEGVTGMKLQVVKPKFKAFGGGGNTLGKDWTSEAFTKVCVCAIVNVYYIEVHGGVCRGECVHFSEMHGNV